MKKAAKCVGWIGMVCVAGALAGCGPALYTTVTPVPSNEGPLAGNWLIAGSLPSGQNEFTAGVTLDEYGTEVDGSSAVSYRCTGTGVDVNTATGPGTLDANGGFTLASPTVQRNPVAEGLTIAANYSSANAPGFGGLISVAAAGSCTLPSSLSFTATKIADLTGTYNGNLQLNLVSVPLGTQVPVTLSLKQGGVPQGGHRFSEAVETGTITFHSPVCVGSGTVVQQGAVGGFISFLEFRLNDGSTLDMQFLTEDLANSTLTPMFATISGSSCLSSVGTSGTFVRQ